MLKHRFIVSIILFAFTVVLAHSIIPHHHHHNDSTLVVKSSNHEDENPLEHTFEHYKHAGNSVDYFLQNTNNSVVADVVFIYPTTSTFNFVPKETTLCFESKQSYVASCVSPESIHFTGLRGPPQI